MRHKFEFTNDLRILVTEWTPSIYLRPFHWHSAWKWLIAFPVEVCFILVTNAIR